LNIVAFCGRHSKATQDRVDVRSIPRQQPHVLGSGLSADRLESLRMVLMGNHYHLLVKTPRANLVSGMPSRLALILEEKLNSKALD
jgi:hypothetical protein